MTSTKLIKDLRARFPTFAVSPDGDLIRVEIPDARTVWIKLTPALELISVAATREDAINDIFARRGTGPGYTSTSVDYLLWRVAHGINGVQSPDKLRRFIGGPFDSVVRNEAHVFVSSIRARVDRRRAEIAEDLAVAQARADRESAAVDLIMKEAWAYLEILEGKP